MSFKLSKPPLFGEVASEVSVPFVFGVRKDFLSIQKIFDFVEVNRQLFLYIRFSAWNSWLKTKACVNNLESVWGFLVDEGTALFKPKFAAFNSVKFLWKTCHQRRSLKVTQRTTSTNFGPEHVPGTIWAQIFTDDAREERESLSRHHLLANCRREFEYETNEREDGKWLKTLSRYLRKRHKQLNPGILWQI